MLKFFLTFLSNYIVDVDYFYLTNTCLASGLRIGYRGRPGRLELTLDSAERYRFFIK